MPGSVSPLILGLTAGANGYAGLVPLTNMPRSSGLSPLSVHQQADRKGKTWTPTNMDQSHLSLCNIWEIVNE
ncbi:hypothetical protein CHARACLAT_018336 [Characodon lateralis]|uniref:Uncharacterized protein n=1 Tax=Characodon lateralis TaxID=208331 RepID=A0ABU7E3M2_9TELE|nr:hypothetical protein [Characodon lateralis]